MKSEIPTYEQMHSRNYGIYSADEQNRIRNATVAVIGQGCVGELCTIVLAKLGVGSITIADADEYSPANMNRNPLASVSTLGKKKTDVIQKFIADAEPYVKIRICDAISSDNASDILEGHDIIIQAVDNMSARVIVHRAAKKLGIPCVTMSGSPPYRSIVSVFMADGIDYEDAFGLPTRDLLLKDNDEVSRIDGIMRTHRAEYAGSHGADPVWAERFISGERRIWSVTPERAYPCSIACVHEAIKHILGKKVIAAPDALVIDKTGEVFSEFRLTSEGVREMVVKDALTMIPQIYRMF